MAGRDGSFLKGRIPLIDSRQKKIFNLAVQIARSRRNQLEVRAGTHVSSVRWRARYRGLIISVRRTAYRGGTVDVTAEVKRERQEVFHLTVRRNANGGRRRVTVLTDRPGEWEKALVGSD